jgi:hypothetical protein
LYEAEFIHDTKTNILDYWMLHHLVLRLVMSRAIPPLPHTPVWCDA